MAMEPTCSNVLPCSLPGKQVRLRRHSNLRDVCRCLLRGSCVSAFGMSSISPWQVVIASVPPGCRRFQPVMVPEPSVDEAYQILLGLRERYEAHHKLRYTDEALEAAAKYSHQYISDRWDEVLPLLPLTTARCSSFEVCVEHTHDVPASGSESE